MEENFSDPSLTRVWEIFNMVEGLADKNSVGEEQSSSS